MFFHVYAHVERPAFLGLKFLVCFYNNNMYNGKLVRKQYVFRYVTMVFDHLAINIYALN